MKQNQDIKNINLSFVCPQNWDNMTICGNGRFCGVCQKTVYDFTDKSQQEYDDIVQKHEGQICGRFRKAQMTPSVNLAKAAAIAAFSLLMAECKVEKLEPVEVSHLVQQHVKEDFMGVIVEQQPEFIGGYKAMFQFLRDNLKWPKEACGEGTVFVGFEVETNGNLTNIVVKRGFHPQFDAEAVRVVKLMSVGMWKGAKQSGKPAKVAYTIPIKFRLE